MAPNPNWEHEQRCTCSPEKHCKSQQAAVAYGSSSLVQYKHKHPWFSNLSEVVKAVTPGQDQRLKHCRFSSEVSSHSCARAHGRAGAGLAGNGDPARGDPWMFPLPPTTHLDTATSSLTHTILLLKSAIKTPSVLHFKRGWGEIDDCLIYTLYYVK